MPLVKTNKDAPESEEVIFYTGKNFTGDAYLSKLNDKVDIFRDYSHLNDKLNSVKIGNLCKVIVFKNDRFNYPDKELNGNTSDIDIGGLSSFIVIDNDDRSIKFTFKDELNDGNSRSMTIHAALFGNVTMPLPDDDNYPKIFATLKDKDDFNHPVVTAVYVRRKNGVYEDPNSSFYFYWDAASNEVKLRDVPEYVNGKLTYSKEGHSTFHFYWGMK